MISHPHPLSDPQVLSPARFCQRCRGEIYPGEWTCRYEERWICPDCFRGSIQDLLAVDSAALVRAMGLELVRFP